ANVRMNTAKFSLFSFYVLNYANSDTSGAGSFPSTPYNISADYGRANFSVRSRFILGGTFNAPYHFGFSPFIIANSGQPYNLTTGQDYNGDSIYNDRPAFATDLSRPSVVRTGVGVFDTAPIAGQTIVPVNYLTGPGNFTINMRISKVFGFGKEGAAGGGPQAGGGGEHRGPGGMGPRHGHGPFGGGSTTNRRYNLTLSLHAMNILNHVNYGNPIGNLSSPYFGVSKSLAGGPFGSNAAVRRIFMQAQFAF
ncbi:MAG TPA: carboxypeptidase regulatory-like domain-containing protein, partial [Terriglobales bacterium]